jgi:hypothetical protein
MSQFDPERSSANSKHISWVGIPHRSAGLPRGHVSAANQRALAVLNERRHYSFSALISKEGARNKVLELRALHETQGCPWPARQRDRLMPVSCAGAEDVPGNRVPQRWLTYVCPLPDRPPARSQGRRLHRGPKRLDRVPMGGGKIRPLACDGRGACGPQCPSNFGQHSRIKARPSCHEDGSDCLR